MKQNGNKRESKVYNLEIYINKIIVIKNYSLVKKKNKKNY